MPCQGREGGQACGGGSGSVAAGSDISRGGGEETLGSAAGAGSRCPVAVRVALIVSALAVVA
eukprot:4891613-Lingulodinium_polyedra.AAC.1